MSLRRGQILINRRRLEHEIETKQLKLWWIAEQIRVDRKTISRWLAGTSKAATNDNIRALAEVLECPFEALCVDEPQEEPALDQKAATAALIREKGLKDLLEPTHNHALLEALLSASIDPSLPPDTLAVLLLDLAHAKFRQHRYREAESHVRHALTLLVDSTDILLRARSWMTLANLLSLQSQAMESLYYFDLSIELARAAPEENLILAKGLSNFAHALLTLGQYQEAEAAVEDALVVHERLQVSTGKVDTSHCTAWRVAMLVALALGRTDRARVCIQQGLPLARELKYRYSELLSLLFEVYIETLEPQPKSTCRENLIQYLLEIETISHHPDACQYAVYGLLNLGDGAKALDIAMQSLKIRVSDFDDALKNVDVADCEWFLGRKASARQRVQEAEAVLRARGYRSRAEEAAAKLQLWTH